MTSWANVQFWICGARDINSVSCPSGFLFSSTHLEGAPKSRSPHLWFSVNRASDQCKGSKTWCCSHLLALRSPWQCGRLLSSHFTFQCQELSLQTPICNASPLPMSHIRAQNLAILFIFIFFALLGHARLRGLVLALHLGITPSNARGTI